MPRNSLYDLLETVRGKLRRRCRGDRRGRIEYLADENPMFEEVGKVAYRKMRVYFFGTSRHCISDGINMSLL